MHSTGRVLQEEGGIISQILYISKYLLDKPWLEIRAEFLTGRRYLGHDTSLEQINSEFEHCLEVLNEQDVRFLLGVTRSDLKFFCPMCSEHFEGLSQYKTLGTKEKEGAVCVICKRVAQFEDFKCVDCNLSAVDSDYYSCLSCLTEYEKEV